jgi:uridine phosphorylase
LAPLWQNIKTYDTIIRINIKSGCVPLEFKTGTYCTQHHFVGDQNRVEKSHNSLTALNFPLKEEFKTQTGLFKGKRISVISTGIGPDNIDIVINELDAVNIDLETRKPKKR